MLLQGGLMCHALLVIFLFYNYKVCACQILEYVGKKDDPISILSIITHCTKCQLGVVMGCKIYFPFHVSATFLEGGGWVGVGM